MGHLLSVSRLAHHKSPKKTNTRFGYFNVLDRWAHPGRGWFWQIAPCEKIFELGQLLINAEDRPVQNALQIASGRRIFSDYDSPVACAPKKQHHGFQFAGCLLGELCRCFWRMPGFGNDFETEALPGALPQGMNSPQKCNYGLYGEQLSGTAFTAPSHQNERTWCYRIRPSVKHSSPLQKIDLPYWKSAPHV
jgi:hypothetical protein